MGTTALQANKDSLHIPGLDDELSEEVVSRITEFETRYEQGEGGWVPKIRKIDYLIAAVINGVILLFWVMSLL